MMHDITETDQVDMKIEQKVQVSSDNGTLPKCNILR